MTHLRQGIYESCHAEVDCLCSSCTFSTRSDQMFQVTGHHRFSCRIVTPLEQEVDSCQACDRKLSRFEFVEEFRGFFMTGIVQFFYAILG